MPFIFATSGSGKTHYVDHEANRTLKKAIGIKPEIFHGYSGRANAGAIDGDTIIGESIGWPPGEWWTTLSSEELREFIGACWDILLPMAKDHFVLFGVPPMDVWQVRELFQRHSFPYEDLHIVHPTFDALARNMSSRQRQLKPGQVKPTDPSLSQHSAIQAIKKFKEATMDFTALTIIKSEDPTKDIAVLHSAWLQDHFRDAAAIYVSGPAWKAYVWDSAKQDVNIVCKRDSDSKFFEVISSARDYKGPTAHDGYEGIWEHHALGSGHPIELLDLSNPKWKEIASEAKKLTRFVRDKKL